MGFDATEFLAGLFGGVSVSGPNTGGTVSEDGPPADDDPNAGGFVDSMAEPVVAVAGRDVDDQTNEWYWQHVDGADRQHLLGPPMGEFSLGMDIVLDYGMGRTILQSEVQEMKMTDWGFQVRHADLLLDVTYPTTYAAAAPSSCTATYEKDGLTVEETHGGRYETGFRCEWKHIHDVVTAGAEPLTPAKDAVKDLELVEDIVQAMVRHGEQGGAT